MEGPFIARKEGPDIISDVTCLGSVQVPGHGQPIVMLADRQTTGGYTKIGVICSVDLGNLAQRLPGQKVRFVKTTLTEAVSLLKQESALFDTLRQLRAKWRSRAEDETQTPAPAAAGGSLNVIVEGVPHRVDWEFLD